MLQHASFDIELIRRYDLNGPRYTSYPTAAQLQASFDPHAYRRSALLSNANACSPLAAYVHIPFCASPCFYCGCNKIVTHDRSKADDYLVRLKKEVAMQSQLFDVRRRLRQLHFGGGTPTFLSPEQIEDLLEHLDHHFLLDRSAAREHSIEIDPRSITEQTLPSLKLLGFNRLSFGVQDFDPDVQTAINRLQPMELTLEAVQQARTYGLESINFDLIYGLPLQTTTSFAKTLEEVIRMNPDRIAAYGYAHLPKLFKAQQAIREVDLPKPAMRLELLKLTMEALTSAGYAYIGMDHFALPSDALARAQQNGQLHRNFQGYSICSDVDLIGLGVSAIGSIGNTYSQNAKQLIDYYRAIDNGVLPIERGVTLTVDDLTRREVIQQIMCQGRVDFRNIGAQYAVDFHEYFASELKALRPMQYDGLLTLTEDSLVIAPKGRLLLRNIAMAFDAYLQPDATRRFSRTI